MYYFKDHLNFTNNLQDNLYILRQRQLKEAAWSPSSGGPAVPESAAGTNELKDRMRNIKQSGDRPQSKEYLEMDAEIKRREGQGSKVNLEKPEGVGRTVVQGTEGNEKFVRTVQTKDGRYWVDPRDRMSGEELAGRAKEVKMSVPALDIVSYGNKDDVSKLKVTVKPPQPKTTAPASSPPPTPYSERGDGLATPKVTPPPTPSPTPYSERGDGLAKPEDGTGKTAEEKLEILKSKDPNYDAFKQKVLVNIQVDKQFPNRQYNSDRKYYTHGQPPAKEESYSKKPDYVKTDSSSSPSTAAKPESTMPGLDPTEPPYFGTDVTNRAPGQPYVVPGSQEWNNMSHDDQHAMAVRALLNNETNKFTGGRNAVDPNSPTGERARFSTDSGEGGPFAADTNERSKIANAVLEKQRLNQNQDAINNWNKSDLADTATFPNRPFFWPKVSNNIPDTGADAGGYGPPKPSTEDVKTAEDTKLTSGRKLIYPGSFEDILDRMQNNDRSKKISSTLKDLRARRNFNR